MSHSLFMFGSMEGKRRKKKGKGEEKKKKSGELKYFLKCV